MISFASPGGPRIKGAAGLLQRIPEIGSVQALLNGGAADSWKRREPPAESADSFRKSAKIRRVVAQNVTLLRQETLTGASYGPSTFKVYDACADGQEKQDPLLIVWLHGADMGDIPAHDLAGMHKRLRRRCVFLAPMSPKRSWDGLGFFWGVSYTKAQNKGGLGFIYGQPHEEFLKDLASAILSVKEEFRAVGVYCMGYSMGGFGVYQLAAFLPTLFDAAVAVAGYGQGTLDKSGATYNAPQPESSNILRAWCDKNCPRLAQVGALVVIHSPTDQESSYTDARAIVDRVKQEGGCVTLVTVPPDMAESDPKSKRSVPSGHRYFNYALLNESSIEILYDRIEAMLAGTALPPAPPSPSSGEYVAQAQGAAGAAYGVISAQPGTVAGYLEAARAQEQLSAAREQLTAATRASGLAMAAQPRTVAEVLASRRAGGDQPTAAPSGLRFQPPDRGGLGRLQSPPDWFQKPVQAFQPAAEWDGGTLLKGPQPSQIPASRLAAIQAAAARFRADCAQSAGPYGSTVGGCLL